MIGVNANVKMPDLTIKPPDSTFYQAAALEVKKRIRVRTESKHLDHNETPFKPYRKEYGVFRAEHGRSTRPNLSYTGKMLGSMRTFFTKKTGKVVLSGEEALKAHGNEARGRIFFAFSGKDIQAVFNLIDRWMARKNGFK